MPSDSPFQQLFEHFGRLPESHSESVNRIPREKLKNWLEVPIGKPGHCLLLKAPRAGHGKTHLLTRLLHELGGSHEFIPLHAVGGSIINASTVLDDVLRRLVRVLPAAGGLTVLDLVARRIFSMALEPLVNSGEVPCQDREAALVALRDRPIETFDFHHVSAVTAHWAKENFELLGPRLAIELAERNGLSPREVSFWVEAMFRFSANQIDNPNRVRILAAQVFESPSADTMANERLIALLGMLTTLLRVVLVADELEGFSLEESGALRFASFICSLRQSVERLDVIISVNQDIWDGAFEPRLSAGLTDRLSELMVVIEPLDHQGVIALIESRMPGEGERIAAGITTTHARGIIREAAELWSQKDLVKPMIPAYAQPESPSVVTLPGSVALVVEPDIHFTPNVDFVAYNSPPPAVVFPLEEAPMAATSDDEAFTWPPPFTAEPIAPTFQAPPTFASESLAPPFEAPIFQVPQIFVPEPLAPPSEATASFAPDSSWSPFQAAPSLATEPEALPFQASPPNPEYVAPPFQAAQEPVAETSTDRVDDLLRQFRERYGKT